MQILWKQISGADSSKLLYKWRLQLAVLTAVLTHFLILLLPSFTNEKHYSNSAAFNVILQEVSEEKNPVSELKEESSEKVETTLKVQPTRELFNQQDLPTLSAEITRTAQSQQGAETNNVFLAGGIIGYEVIKRFAETEVESNLNVDQTRFETFSESFVAPKAKLLKDTEKLANELDGGAYKVRKNGVECVVLKMVPQSFDEMNTVGTISGSGSCVDKNKKMRLLDDYGKLLNSDRFD